MRFLHCRTTIVLHSGSNIWMNEFLLTPSYNPPCTIRARHWATASWFSRFRVQFSLESLLIMIIGICEFFCCTRSNVVCLSLCWMKRTNRRFVRKPHEAKGFFSLADLLFVDPRKFPCIVFLSYILKTLYSVHWPEFLHLKFEYCMDVPFLVEVVCVRQS